MAETESIANRGLETRTCTSRGLCWKRGTQGGKSSPGLPLWLPEVWAARVRGEEWPHPQILLVVWHPRATQRALGQLQLPSSLVGAKGFSVSLLPPPESALWHRPGMSWAPRPGSEEVLADCPGNAAVLTQAKSQRRPPYRGSPTTAALGAVACRHR